MFTLPNQPRSIFGILADSFQLYKPAFLKLLPISIVFSLLNAFPFLKAIDNAIVSYLVTISVIIIFFWLQLIVFHIINQIALQSKARYKDAFLNVSQRFSLCFFIGMIMLAAIIFAILIGTLAISPVKPFLVNWFPLVWLAKKVPDIIPTLPLSEIITTLPFLIVVNIPLVFLMILLRFSIPEALLNNGRIFDPLKQSIKLVWKNWWRTFAIFLLTYLLVLPLVLPIWGIKLVALSHNKELLWPDIMMALMNIIILPWTAVVLIRQYYDLKLRRQSWQKTFTMNFTALVYRLKNKIFRR